MKKIVVIIALSISIVACNKQAEVKEVKTAYVDTSVLMKEYTATKDLDAKYKAKGEEKGRQLQAEIDKLNATKMYNGLQSVEKEYNGLQPVEKGQSVGKGEEANRLKSVLPTATYDDFMKIDLRTATIIAAEPMPKSDKLLKLTVDLGFEQRTILSGIAKHFSAEAVVGQQVMILANLAPRKMMGIESNGMVLLAENAEGKLDFVKPQTEGFGNGLIVK